jgi:hypothetical protein
MKKQKLVIALVLVFLFSAFAEIATVNIVNASAQPAVTNIGVSNNASSSVLPDQTLNSLLRQFDSDKDDIRRQIQEHAKEFNSNQPIISITSIQENQTYSTNNITLCFAVSEPSTYKYCINGKENITIAGNTTLTQLPIGHLRLIVYAEDSAGNVGTLQAVNFTITQQKETETRTEPFLAIYLLAAAGAAMSMFMLVAFSKQRCSFGGTECSSGRVITHFDRKMLVKINGESSVSIGYYINDFSIVNCYSDLLLSNQPG